MPGWPKALALGLLLTVSIAGPGPAETGLVGDPFADCEARFRVESGNRGAVRCFYEIALERVLWKEATRRLQGHLSQNPQNPWLHFYLGHLDAFDPGAEERYRSAARILNVTGDVTGEFDARINLVIFKRRRGQMEQSEEELLKALEISEKAATSGRQSNDMTARACLEKARHLMLTGGDLGHVYRLLLDVEELVFPDGSYTEKRDCLDSLGQVTFELGRYRESLAISERHLELAEAENDAYSEAYARYILTLLHTKLELPSESRREETRRLASEALAAAVAIGHRPIEAQTHRLLAQLEVGDKARQHATRCLTMAAELGTPDLRSTCLAAMARHQVDENPQEAGRLLDEALAVALDSENPWDLVYSWAANLRALAMTHPRTEILASSLLVLDEIESLRDAQMLEPERVRLVSVWSHLYYRIAGLLLEWSESSYARADVELAFEVIERLRARLLLEAHESARSPAPREDPLSHRLAEVLGNRTRVYRQLLDPRLVGAERTEILESLDALEHEESELRYQLARRGADGAAVRTDMATLSQIEASLGPHEALLSFQVSLWEDLYGQFAGGSWLLVITRDGTRSYRLVDRARLEPATRLLLGLDDPEEVSSALVRLYRELLGPAVLDLPPEIEHLVIVPDAILHLLPFSVLRATEEGAPLASRFRLTEVPSASLWLDWRRRAPPPSEAPLLVLADPAVLPESNAEGKGSRDWALASGSNLGRLPYARREARAAVRHVRRAARNELLEGEEATEHFVKTADLRSFAVLHFAAHAVIDEENPRRSAVVLAPGSDREDGFLHPQEIAELSLDGRVVVLSTCSSASGEVLEGAGVMSLARAFFQAGAHVVVGSLWPLPDDKAAAFFDEFYRHLGRGLDVSSALTAAQRARIAAGASAVEWSGIVALGNGDLVPFPGGRKTRGLSATTSMLALGLASALVLLALARRSRPRA